MATKNRWTLEDYCERVSTEWFEQKANEVDIDIVAHECKIYSYEWLKENIDVIDIELTNVSLNLDRTVYQFQRNEIGLAQGQLIQYIFYYKGQEMGEIRLAPDKRKGRGTRWIIVEDPDSGRELGQAFFNLCRYIQVRLYGKLIALPQMFKNAEDEVGKQRKGTPPLEECQGVEHVGNIHELDVSEAELEALERQAELPVDSGTVGEEATAAEDEDSSLVKILFLAANPADTDRLRLDAEMRAIDLALQQALFRDRFDLRQHWAVQVTDLQHCLLRHQPDIVHFSGHGSVSSEIVLEDVSGNSRPVSVGALSELFSVLKDNIKCVVLNACYSEQQAQAIAQSIDCVIGMSKAIGDDAAIGFATAFYQALGFGRDVKTAFELGRVQIDLEGLDEQDTPKLLALKIPPENIFFIKQAQ